MLMLCVRACVRVCIHVCLCVCVVTAVFMYVCFAVYNQGSKKLDKAEILEMSIEYIQRIQQQAFGKAGASVTGGLCSGHDRVEHAVQFRQCSFTLYILQVLIC